MGEPVGSEEHMLGSAEPNALSTKFSRRGRIARNICIGADAKLAALIRPLHERGECATVRIGVHGIGLTQNHAARRAVERKPVPFLERVLADLQDLFLLVHLSLRTASHT